MDMYKKNVFVKYLVKLLAIIFNVCVFQYAYIYVYIYIYIYVIIHYVYIIYIYVLNKVNFRCQHTFN